MSQNFAQEIESIISRLQPIRLEVLQAEQDFQKELDHVYSGSRQSARNLVHYLGLRRHDMRELQEDLGRLALSSLGRLESHVIATLDALMALLHKITGKNWDGRAVEETFAEFDSGSVLLEKHTVEALGEAPANRNVRIMVTMPSAAADDPLPPLSPAGIEGNSPVVRSKTLQHLGILHSEISQGWNERNGQDSNGRITKGLVWPASSFPPMKSS
jgi:hypothetical protein